MPTAACHEALGGRGIVLKVSNLTGEVRDLMRRDELEKVFGDIGPGQSAWRPSCSTGSRRKRVRHERFLSRLLLRGPARRVAKIRLDRGR
jgi:hypothetical protein